MILMPATSSTSPPPQDGRSRSETGGALAQGFVLLLTYALGMIGLFPAQDPWFVALGQAAMGFAAIHWLVRRHEQVVVLVPVASIVLTAGLAVAAHTVPVACSGAARESFDQLPPPPGASVEMFVSPSQGCMVEVKSDQLHSDQLSDHYRRELTREGWRIDSDHEEGLRAERGDVLLFVQGPEDGRKVYVTLNECGGWGLPCAGPDR
jgi:hypothetical protein